MCSFDMFYPIYVFSANETLGGKSGGIIEETMISTWYIHSFKVKKMNKIKHKATDCLCGDETFDNYDEKYILLFIN